MVRRFFCVFALLLLPLWMLAQSIEAPLLQGSEARAVPIPSTDNAWGGIRSDSTEQTLSDRVVQYEISAELDPMTHRVVGAPARKFRFQPCICIFISMPLLMPTALICGKSMRVRKPLIRCR